MRLFVQLANGVPKAWPLIGDNVRYLAPPNVSFPQSTEAYELVDLTEFGFETFIEAAQPAFDPLAQKVVDSTPVKVLGQWTRQWSVVALTPAEITAAQANAAQAAALADANTTIKNDTLIATWKAKNWATFSADFDALTTANKLDLLKRSAFATLKRVV